MCFGGNDPQTPDTPTYRPPAIPTPPPAPAPVIRAPALQQNLKPKETKVRNNSSTRDRMGIKRGSSQLRIPLNTGSGSSGGLNV